VPNETSDQGLEGLPADRPGAPLADDPEASIAGNGRREIAALADDLLPALIARLSASSLGELEVREGSWRVRLRRSPPAGDTAAGDTAAGAALGGRSRPTRAGHAPGAVTDGADGQSVSGPAAAARPPIPSQRDAGRHLATSPAVGYFAPRDGVAVGFSVRSGDVLGHIDVLGVRQEVVSPEDGIVARLLAEPGEAVEYGQELVRIERVVKGARAGAQVDGPGAEHAPNDFEGTAVLVGATHGSPDVATP